MRAPGLGRVNGQRRPDPAYLAWKARQVGPSTTPLTLETRLAELLREVGNLERRVRQLDDEAFRLAVTAAAGWGIALLFAAGAVLRALT